MAKILVVEDDLVVSGGIADCLAGEHHTVDEVADGKDALHRVHYYDYDLIILDWQLPGMSGVDICKQFRSDGGKTPILMLTGKGAVTDKETGLDAGADDYLTKPFEIRELTARVRALLRRPAVLLGNILKTRSLTLDRDTYRVTVNSAECKVMPREFALLEFLMRHPKQLFNADDLLNRVWSSESDASSYALRQSVKRLRDKLAEHGAEDLIVTVRNIGYKLED